MKATGIVRKMDDLGRVVIPIELRRAMDISEGDPLEVYTDDNGAVILKKFAMKGICLVCSGEKDVREIKGKHICLACCKEVDERSE